jgi:hypothetical protein
LERTEELGVTMPGAEAYASRNRLGENTVAVRTTYSTGNGSSSSTSQLTEEAAQALLSDLLRVVKPAEPRFRVEVHLDKDNSPLRFENARYRRGPAWLSISDEQGESHFNTRFVRYVDVDKV